MSDYGLESFMDSELAVELRWLSGIGRLWIRVEFTSLWLENFYSLHVSAGFFTFYLVSSPKVAHIGKNPVWFTCISFLPSFLPLPFLPPLFPLLFIFFLCWDMVSHTLGCPWTCYIAKDDLELPILRPLPTESQHYRHAHHTGFSSLLSPLITPPSPHPPFLDLPLFP